jgi:DNA-binding response OmpR family regulator
LASIIVIDDDAQIVDLLVQMLSAEGHQVLGAVDAEAAMELFAEHPADLIITDIIMPNKDGFETIQAFRHCDHDVKILAISGGGRFGEGSFLREAKMLGADMVLMKPLDRKQLVESVRQLVGS